MKNLITYLKALWGAWGNLQSSDVRHDCRRSDLRRSPSGLDAKWKQNPFMRFAVVLTLIFTIGSGNVWGAETTKTTCVGTGSGYGTRRTATYNSIGWVLSTGQDGYLGTGSATGHGNTKPTADDLPVVKAQYASATTSTTGYYYYYTTTAIANVTKIEFSYTGKKGSSTVNAYVVSSSTAASSGSAAWSKPTLASGTGLSAQGANIASATGTYTFKLKAKETSSKYYGIILKTGSYSRLTTGTIKIYVDDAAAYTITVTRNNNSYGTVSLSGTTITADPEDCYQVISGTGGYTLNSGTATITHTGTSNTISVTPTSNCSITVNFEKKTVNTYIDEIQDYGTTEGCETEAPSLEDKTPATSGTCAQQHWHFMGWVTAANKANPTDLNIITPGTTIAVDGATYYAVWAKGEGSVFDGSTEGTYLIYANDNGTNYYATNTVSSNSLQTTSTIGSAQEFTLAKSGDYWTISYKSGNSTYYLTASSTATINAFSTTSSTWRISSGTYGTWRIWSSSTNNGSDAYAYRALMLNSSHAFKNYCPDDDYLDCEIGTPIEYSDYICACCTELGSINGSVNLTTDGCGAGELKATWKMLATTGIASQTLRVYDENLEEVTAKRITGITASTSNQTKTISGLNPCKEYYVTVENVSSGGEYCAPGDPWESDVVTTLGYTLSVTKSNCSITSGSEPARICNNVSVTYAAATGYALPTSITVTNAGVQNSGWTWNSGTGVLTINKANVTGNVTVTITPTCVSPVITADPADANYYVGDSPEALSVTATLASGTLTYLWKVSTNGGSTWSDATGTNNTFSYSGASLSTASAGTLKFKCIVGNSEGGCSVESGVATITVSNASYFPNGKTIFIQAESSSAWSDANYDCVKAWFHTAGGSETAQTTYWLFDATGGDSGKKLFAAIVPATGDLPYLDIQRFTHDCSDWRNKNGGCSYSDANGSNTIRSTGNTDTKDAQDDYIRWNVSGVTIDLYGDPSDDDWASSLASFSDQGAGVWTATYENYAPANAAGESQDFKAKTNYNGWIGNTGSNNNATLDGMHVGSTYNITATLDVKDHSLTMSKTFVKGTVHFDLQGHGLAISDLTNVAAGSKISAPSAPSATGWDFGGWYKEPACTNAWNFGSDVVNETMTLYAKWTKHNYTITSTLNHCSSSPAIPSSYEYTGSAASLSYTITPSSGYRLPTEITVSGTTYTWNPATGALVLTGIITNNVTITISAVQTHTVDWYVGGSAPANKIGDDGQTTVVDHGGKISDFPAHDPDGSACDKTFVGWTNTSSYVHGTSPLFNDVAGSPTINADASFYAVFAEVNVATGYTYIGDEGMLEAGETYIFVSSKSTGSAYALKSSDLPQNNTSGVKGTAVSVTVATGIKVSAENSDLEFTCSTHTEDEMDVLVLGSSANTLRINGNGIGYGDARAYYDNTGLYGWNNKGDTYYDVYYNSTSTKFEASSSASGRVYAYKKGGTTYTGHTITCADCGTSVMPTYTAAPTGGTVSVTKSAAAVASGSTVKTCTSVDLTVTITPASHYTLTGFTATGLSTGTATISPAVGSTLPKTTETTFTVTVSSGATGTLNLTPTFTPETPLTITLSTNSKGTFTNPDPWPIYSGESFTFPDVTPNDPSCATFVGWIEGTTFVGDGTTHDAPVTIAAGSSSGAQSSNTTYTAVFYETETSESDAYVKVTAAPEPPATWANDHYLIVYEDAGNSYTNAVAFAGSRDNGDNGNIDATSNGIAVTIVGGNTIAATSSLAANEWRIAAVTGGYSIQSASGYYIGRAANSNGIDASNSTAYVNTIGYSDSRTNITSAGGKILKYNTAGDQLRFRYLTSAGDIQLYKLGTAVVETRTYTTNPSCTPKYRVTVASVTGGSPSADPKFNPESTTVTITANPSAGYSFTSWTITKTTGGDNVTSTLLTGDKPTTANTTFTMPAYDITIAATYAKKMVTELKVMDDETVVANTTGPVSGTLNVSTGANKTLDVVITPSDAFDHSWTATVSAGGTYASITNVTAEGFRVNGLAQGDATITVNAPNDGSAKSVTLTVQVRDIMPEEIILKRDGSNTPIETLIMYYDETNSKGQYVKVNVGYSPANPTNKAFTFSSALTGKVGSHSHAPASGYEVLVANGVTSDAVNCTFTSSADGSVTKVLAVTVLPILSDRFVDYVHGNATQTVSARLSDDRYSIIPDINTPSLSDASDSDPTSEDCETAHYHLVGWLPQTTAEALWAAGTPITDATEGLVRAGESVEATGQTWCAIWAEEAE